MKLNIANVSEVGRHAEMSVVADSAGTRRCGKMLSPTLILVANVGNRGVPKSIVNAFRMARSVGHSANARTVATANEYQSKLSESGSRLFSISPHL